MVAEAGTEAISSATCGDVITKTASFRELVTGSTETSFAVISNTSNEQKDVEPVLADLASESTQTVLCGLINAFCVPKKTAPVVILDEGQTGEQLDPSLLLLAHTACQTMAVGFSAYHKATQMPEMSYNPYTNKNVVRMAESVRREPSVEEAVRCPAVVASTQTDMVGHTWLHKAVQFPEREYADPGHPPAILPVVWPSVQTSIAGSMLALQQQYIQQQFAQTQHISMSHGGNAYYMQPSLAATPYYTDSSLQLLDPNTIMGLSSHQMQQQQHQYQQPPPAQQAVQQAYSANSYHNGAVYSYENPM